MTIHITDEMPDTWVRTIADGIEIRGWAVDDAHESAIVITLTPDAAEVLAADRHDRYLVIGWSGDGDAQGVVEWGLSSDGVQVPVLRPLGGTDPAVVAERAHRVLTGGRPEPRNLRHAIPYAAATGPCTCQKAYPCGGIVPDTDCPEHGNRRTPAMGWHWEANCPPWAGQS